MRFFRRRSSPGFLALLALAMQLGLVSAQTHSHSHAIGPGHRHIYGLSSGQTLWARNLAASFCHANAQRSCPAPAPAHDHPACPICQAVSLASLSIVQAPPALPPTPARSAILAPQRAVASLRGADTVHFRARAPPIA
jgi:hypothetical protein